LELTTTAGPAPREGGAQHTDRDDLLILGVAIVAVSAIWLLLGWRWRLLVSGLDAPEHGLVVLKELVSAAGRWDGLLYRTGLLGGVEMREQLGPLPQFAALARLGLAPVAIWNLTCLLDQVLLVFFGARAASALARALSPESTPARWPEWLAVTGLVGFAPVLGWRFGYGHVGFIGTSLPFLAGASLILAANQGTMTATLAIAAAASIVCALLSTGQQILLGAAIFGAPLLLAVWLVSGARRRGLTVPLLIAAAALLIALPGLGSLLAHAFGPDTPRQVGRGSVVFDYVIAGAKDWLGSVPWTTAAIPAGREQILWHETNYPLGPLLLLLVLLVRRRGWVLLLALTIGVGAVVLLASGVEPVASAILRVAPPLSSFRVPARALLPIGLIVPVLAAAAVLARRRAASAGWSLAAAPLVVLPLAAAPPVVRELAAWLCAAAIVSALLVRGLRRLPVPALLLVLAGLSVCAFRERLLPFMDGGRLLDAAAALGASVRRAQPTLGPGLERVSLDADLPGLQPNTAFAAGLSSLDGYQVPTRRFLELAHVLAGERYQPTVVFMRFPPGDAVLDALYDVRWRVTFTAAGQVSVAAIGLGTAGAAWIPERLETLPSVPALVARLRAVGGTVADEVRRTLFLVGEDERRSSLAGHPSIDQSCASARVLGLRSDGSSVLVSVESPAPCALVLATNYVERLHARVVSEGSSLEAPVFPAYHSLAAIWMPPGRHVVVVGPRVRESPGAWLGSLVGAGLLAGVAVLSRRRG
jgi:hypothetical protein